jgi:cell division protein FtsN
MDEGQIFEMQFIQLISSLYSSCMFQLGKVINPMTGKIDKDLNGAKATIDLLRMLEAKTQGNLSEQEKSALADALSNMQMNYVDEVKREQEKKAEPEAKKETGPKAEEKKKEQDTKKQPEAETKEKPESKTEEEQKTKTNKADKKKSSGGKDAKGRIIVP